MRGLRQWWRTTEEVERCDDATGPMGLSISGPRGARGVVSVRLGELGGGLASLAVGGTMREHGGGVLVARMMNVVVKGGFVVLGQVGAHQSFWARRRRSGLGTKGKCGGVVADLKGRRESWESAL